MKETERSIVNRLVSELGRVVTAVHTAGREAPEAETLTSAHSRIAEATELIVELARGSASDGETVCRAWQAIAAAQDAAARARHAVLETRRQRDAAMAAQRDAQEQTARALAQAARIRWSWGARGSSPRGDE